MMQHKTVIVGAGTAGMALQHRLSRYYRVVFLKFRIQGSKSVFWVIFRSKNVILSRFRVKTCDFRSFLIKKGQF